MTESPLSGIGLRINLAALMDDPHLGEGMEPSALYRTDGRALLYQKAVNILYGQAGSGKSWLMLHVICQTLRKGKRAVLLDYESGPPYTALRLRELGLISTEVGNLSYHRAAGTITAADVAALIAEDPALVVIDSTAEALSAAGLDENLTGDVASWMARTARLLAEANATVLLVDHVGKQPAGLGPRGSNRKLEGVTGISLRVDVETPWCRDVAGSALLTVAKDRLGYVGPQGATIARVRFLPGPDGALTVVVDPPGDDAMTSISPAPRQRGRDVAALMTALSGLASPLRTTTADEEVASILGWSRQRSRDRIAEAMKAGELVDDDGLLRLVAPSRADLRLVEEAFPGTEDAKR